MGIITMVITITVAVIAIIITTTTMAGGITSITGSTTMVTGITTITDIIVGTITTTKQAAGLPCNSALRDRRAFLFMAGGNECSVGRVIS